MNNKGEMNVGLILMTAITLIVGLVIFGSAIIPNVVSVTETIATNTSDASGTEFTPGGLGIISELNGKVVTDFTAWNGTHTIDSGNWTISDNQLNTAGELTAQINCSGEVCVGAANPWNISYTYQPNGYISSAGGRSIAGLILIFVALAILVVALVPTLRNGALDLAGV